jgi:hypothetical protein
MEKDMAEVFNIGPILLYIKEIGKMIWLMDKGD